MTRSVVLAIALLAGASSSFAQTAPAGAAPRSDSGVVFLPRYDFHLSAEHLSSDDVRFVWDTNFGGELDLIGVGSGRGTFYANYQAILGNELRRFDPNQGNYILGGRLSGRVGGIEIGGGIHHESRHLSDRIKQQPVDWNMLAVRVRKEAVSSRALVDGSVEARTVMLKSFVDYNWEVDGNLLVRYAVQPAVQVMAHSTVEFLGTDGSQDRGTQVGLREEGGVRLVGRAAAIELFVAVERRVDPYPLAFGVSTWVTTGFRLVSR